MSEWVHKALQVCGQEKFKKDEDEDLSKVPWLVWERAEEKTSATMRMAMHEMTRLFCRRQQS